MGGWGGYFDAQGPRFPLDKNPARSRPANQLTASIQQLINAAAAYRPRPSSADKRQRPQPTTF